MADPGHIQSYDNMLIQLTMAHSGIPPYLIAASAASETNYDVVMFIVLAISLILGIILIILVSYHPNNRFTNIIVILSLLFGNILLE